MKDRVQIVMLQTFLIFLFTLLLHILFQNVNLAKESLLNARVSDCGLVSGGGSIIAKKKMPCFAMFVYRP